MRKTPSDLQKTEKKRICRKGEPSAHVRGRLPQFRRCGLLPRQVELLAEVSAPPAAQWQRGYLLRRGRRLSRRDLSRDRLLSGKG